MVLKAAVYRTVEKELAQSGILTVHKFLDLNNNENVAQNCNVEIYGAEAGIEIIATCVWMQKAIKTTFQNLHPSRDQASSFRLWED